MTLTLMERCDDAAEVRLVYHGKDQVPKITIDVTERPFDAARRRTTTLVPERDDLVLDMYYHPFVYAV